MIMQFAIDRHAIQMAREVLAQVLHLLFQEDLLEEERKTTRVKTAMKNPTTTGLTPPTSSYRCQ